jgi:DNA polymerase III delta subunit
LSQHRTSSFGIITLMAKRTAAKSKFHIDPSMRIIVLHGKDPFQISARTREVADALRAIHGEIEQFDYDGEVAEIADVLDELRSYGLIQQHKMVVLDKAEAFLAANERRRPAMEAYAKAPVDSATLVMRAETWRAGNLDKFIKKAGLIYKVEPPNEQTAVRWCISRISKRHDATIEPDAAQRLVEQIGPELGRLDVELAKLAASTESNQPITRAMVTELVGMSREEKVWELQSAIVTGQPGYALTKLRELMVVSRIPETLVTWAVCDLLRKIHAAAHLMREGVNSFAVGRQLKLFGDSSKPILTTAERCSPEKLAELLQHAIQTDVNNKSGTGDSTRSLEALTVQIADVIGSAQRSIRR